MILRLKLRCPPNGELCTLFYSAKVFKESVIVLVLLFAYALYAGYLSKELW